MPFAVHRAIVQPDRRDGANAVDERLRFSHLEVSGSAGAFPSFGSFTVILHKTSTAINDRTRRRVT